MKLTVNITGAKEVLKKLETMSNQARADSIVASAVRMGAILVEADAKRDCPVDLGRLRASITHEMKIEKDAEITARVGTNVEYAPYVEFGTGKYAVKGDGRTTPWIYFYGGKKRPQGYKYTEGARAHPFLFPALEKNARKIQTMIANAVKQAVKIR